MHVLANLKTTIKTYNTSQHQKNNELPGFLFKNQSDYLQSYYFFEQKISINSISKNFLRCFKLCQAPVKNYMKVLKIRKSIKFCCHKPVEPIFSDIQLQLI